MKKIFLVLLVFSTVLVAQKERQPILFESYVFPGDSTECICNILYKVPFSNLVFIKDGERYTAGIQIFYEIQREDEIVKRISSSQVVWSNTYNETISPNHFLEGVTKLSLEKGIYKIIPNVKLQNTKLEIPLKQFSISVEVKNANLVNSIIVNSDNEECKGKSYKRIVNSNNYIPFDTKKYDIIATFSNCDVYPNEAEIFQDNKKVAGFSLLKYISGAPIIEKCNEALLFLFDGKSEDTRTYLLKGVNANLKEGEYSIHYLKDGKLITEQKSCVVWFNKPHVLYNIETAVDIYKKVTDDFEVEVILDAPEELYYNRFFTYWNKYDSDTTTVFNELLSEFYLRADVAEKKFKTANNFSGAKTDRGIIYIKYGEPTSIRRNYNEMNKTVEIWYYDNLNREFVFEDTAGLGNYLLVK